jgi:phosphoribosylformylglycinamidine synthase subunit PurS
VTATEQAYHADVFVTLKRLVNDPEGIEIRNGLHNLGYAGVSEVRSGKYMQLQVNAISEDEAFRQVSEMCERLLCNTVIEEYRVDISHMP